MHQIKDNNTADKYISLSTILRGICMAGIILLIPILILQFLFGLPFYADFLTYVLTALLCLFLYCFAKSTNNQLENTMRLGVVTFVIIIFLQRIFSLIVLPFSFSGFPRFPLYSLEEFNKAILIYIVLLAAFFLGIKAALSLPFRNKYKKPVMPELARIRTTLYIIAIISLCITSILGSIMGWKMGTNWESGWIVRLFPNSLYFIMLALLCMWYGNALPKRDKIIIATYFAFWFLSSLSQGSRSGIYGIALILLICGIVMKGNISFPKKSLKIFLIIIIITGPIIWIMGTSIRSVGQWRLNLDISELLMAVPHISSRLSGPTDNYIKIINDWGDKEIIDSVLTLTNSIKVGINGFVPGELFEVPFNSSGNLWVRFMYGEPLGLRVHGESWSGFGFYYLLVGYGVVMIVFLWALLSTLTLRFLLARKTLFSTFIAIEFYLIYVYDFFNKGMLDSLIADTFLFGSYILIFYFILIIVVGATSRAERQEQLRYAGETVD